MIFRKDKDTNQNFNFNGEHLSIVSTYKYLGLTIHRNGSFSQAKLDLSKKGTKVAYSVKNTLQSDNFETINSFLKAFDAMVKPVILYGSDVWGIEEVLKLSVNDTKLFYCNKVFEKTQLSFCKQILRVSKRASNIAVLLELGRSPMLLNVILNVVKSYCRMRLMDSTRLVKQIFNETRSCKLSLEKAFFHICIVLDIDKSSYNFCSKDNSDK